MKIIIGSDHAAFDEKAEIKAFLEVQGCEVQDAGTHSLDSCDYPDFAQEVAASVCVGIDDPSSDLRGILVCGTGIGMSIAANRFKGIRAALCYTPEAAEMSRAHNDANILCLGARVLEMDLMKEIIKTWLKTDFEGGRHSRRLAKIEDF